MIQAFHQFTENIRSTFGKHDPSREQLDQIAQELLHLSLTTRLDRSAYRVAKPGEEVLHELSICPANGPSLYLASDGVGVTNPPHDHHTWAVIVGVNGVELNMLYQVVER